VGVARGRRIISRGEEGIRGMRGYRVEMRLVIGDRCRWDFVRTAVWEMAFFMVLLLGWSWGIRVLWAWFFAKSGRGFGGEGRTVLVRDADVNSAGGGRKGWMCTLAPCLEIATK
jgi:hypothetical protein